MTKDATNPSNPNGANQYQLDPRQQKCWAAYINPASETFGSARASAIAAGYEEAYADQITGSDWFIAKVRRLNLLDKSEKVLEEMLDMPVETSTVEFDDGDDAEPHEVLSTNPQLVKIKQDTAKFVSERLGKAVGYSTRTEVSGPDGEPLFDDDHRNKANKAIDSVIPN